MKIGVKANCYLIGYKRLIWGFEKVGFGTLIFEFSNKKLV